MNPSILINLSFIQREKYLLLKEAQELLYQIFVNLIRYQSHTNQSDILFGYLQEIDEAIYDLESSIDKAKEVLDQMDLNELKERRDDDLVLYNKLVKPTVQ